MLGQSKSATVTDDANPHTAEDRLHQSSSLVDEAAVFASPLPLTGDRKTTTRVELWVSCESNVDIS
jgi:hypothetical protein